MYRHAGVIALPRTPYQFSTPPQVRVQPSHPLVRRSNFVTRKPFFCASHVTQRLVQLSDRPENVMYVASAFSALHVLDYTKSPGFPDYHSALCLVYQPVTFLFLTKGERSGRVFQFSHSTALNIFTIMSLN